MFQALKGLSCLIVVSSFCNKIGLHAFQAYCVWLIKLIRPKRIMWLWGWLKERLGINKASIGTSTVGCDQWRAGFCRMWSSWGGLWWFPPCLPSPKPCVPCFFGWWADLLSILRMRNKSLQYILSCCFCMGQVAWRNPKNNWSLIRIWSQK